MALNAGHTEADFADETARLRATGVLGESGRLLELFDFLAGRGGSAESASQADIAHQVFGQQDTQGDDATVRVYVHRLRKRLEEFYADPAQQAGAARLVIPAGTYALKLVDKDRAANVPAPARRGSLSVMLLALLLLAAAFLAGWLLRPASDAPRVNAIWQPFLDSDRPIMIAAGDYYIYGEYAPDFPEIERLVRDFEINSSTDLARMQESDPDNFARTEDLGLNYLPFSSAYALQSLVPVLAQGGHEVSVIAASDVTSDTFRTHNIVYVGLVSGMGLLEDVSFTGSGFSVGQNYDELIDSETGRRFMSEEALSLASSRYYRDYGLLSVFREPGGALVAVVAGARDTGLRGIAPIVTAGDLPDELGPLAQGVGFEALFEITGQQGADLSEEIVVARNRP